MKKVFYSLLCLSLFAAASVQAQVVARPTGGNGELVTTTPVTSTADSPVWYTLMSSHNNGNSTRTNRFLYWDGTALGTTQYATGFDSNSVENPEIYAWRLEAGSDGNVMLVSKYDGSAIDASTCSASTGNPTLYMSTAGSTFELKLANSFSGGGDNSLCVDYQWVLDYTGLTDFAFLNCGDTSISFRPTLYNLGKHYASGWFFYTYVDPESGETGGETGGDTGTPVTLPYEVDFTSELNGWTPYDANGDGLSYSIYTWGGGATVTYSWQARTNDDYLFSPLITFPAAGSYQITVTAESLYCEKVEILHSGTSLTDPSGYTSAGALTGATSTFVIAVAQAGDYRIALHDTSNQAGYESSYVYTVAVAEYTEPGGGETGGDETVLTLPYRYSFADNQSLGDWTPVNANSDYYTWTTNASGAYSYPYTNGNDDYLVSPLFSLEAGKTYDVTLNLGYLSNSPSLSLVYGTGDDATTYTSVGKFTLVDTATPSALSFTVETSGNYHIAIYDTSGYGNRVTIGSIDIAEATGGDTPVVTTGLTVPQTWTFTGSNQGDWTTVDDGVYPRWTFGSNGVYTNLGDPGTASNDYLLSPLMAFEAGKTYRVAVDWHSNSYDTDNFTVQLVYGQGDDTSTYTNAGTFTITKGATTYLEFTVEATGDYYFGLHDVSTVTDYYGGGIYVAGLTIFEPTGDEPAEPEATLPYEVTWASDCTDLLGWTPYDANGDGETWDVFNMPEYEVLCGAVCGGYQYTNDDYLISPLFSFEAGMTYQITVTISPDRKGNDYDMEVMIGTALDGSDYTAIGTITNCGGGEENAIIYTPTTSGVYRIALHDQTAATEVQVGGVAIDAVVTAPYSYDFATEGALGWWTACDNNGDGNTFEVVSGFGAGIIADYGAQVVCNDYLVSPYVTMEAGKTYQIDVTVINYSGYGTGIMSLLVGTGRDVTQLFWEGDLETSSTEIAPQTTTFNYTPDAAGNYRLAIYDQSELSGLYVYSVSVTEIETPVVVNELINEDFTDGTYDGEWTTIDGNEDGTWAFATGVNGISLGTTMTSGGQDDWLISPAMDFEEGKSYIVSYTISASGSMSPETVDVYYGTAATAEGMTNLVANESFQGEISRTYRITPAAGTYYLGFHATSPAFNGRITISTAYVAESNGVIPVAVDDLAAELNSQAQSVTLSWTNPAIDTENIALDGTLTVRIYCNGNAIYDKTGCTPGAADSYTYSPDPFGGNVTYYVTTFVTEDKPSSTSNEVSLDLGDFSGEATLLCAWGAYRDDQYNVTTYDPFSEWTLYDMNGGSSLEYYSTNNNGWQTTGTGSFNDWIISPAIELTKGENRRYVIETTFQSGYNGNGADFEVYYGSAATVEAMTNLVASYDNVCLEGTAGNAWINFATDQESYEDGTYYFAIRITGARNTSHIRRFAISYFSNESSSVESLMAASRVYSYGSTLVVPADIAAVAVYDLQGRRVMSATATGEVSLEGLSHGIYVVKAINTAGAVQTVKIVK